jgi:cysteinyl-tRNA synthetase
MSADLDTATGFALLLGAARDANRSLDAGAGADATPVAGFVATAADAFGLSLGGSVDTAPAVVRELLAQRDAARADRRWADSDALRDRIAEHGWDVRDRRGEPAELVRRP